MRRIREIHHIQHAAALMLGLLAGCGEHAENDSPQRVASTALSAIECQDVAAKCLSTLPSAAEAVDCTSGLTACFEDVLPDAQAFADATGECASDAAACTGEATTDTDALKCTATFASCVNKMLDLPPLPKIDGLNGAMTCERETLSCVANAAEPDALAACTATFQECIAEFVTLPPVTLPPITLPPITLPGPISVPPLPDLSAQLGCFQEALECVNAAKTPDEFSACSTASLTCAGLNSGAP